MNSNASSTMNSFESFLVNNNLEMPCYPHSSAITCEDFDRLNIKLPAAKTKNLFLRDKKGHRHFLLTVPPQKSVDLEVLAESLGVSRLGMASAERLQYFLGVLPGSVSVLSLFHDKNRKVELILDDSLWQAPAIQAHPFKNTSTMIVSHKNLNKFLNLTGHSFDVVTVPTAQFK